MSEPKQVQVLRSAQDDSDSTRPARVGEEIDLKRLGVFLAAKLPELATGEIAVEQFPGGYSNLTYLVRAGDAELVLRRPPRGAQVKGGHDMAREFTLLSALHGPYGKVPRPLTFCDDERVIGAPFYLMERVHGLILRGTVPAHIALRAVSETLIDALSDLHAFDWRSAGLEKLGHPDGYVARQVDGWTARYATARTGDVPALERVAAWLGAHRPADSNASLIHNDYKFDNVVLHAERPTEIVAVLDWEMATVGDPLMDLGSALAYWMDAADPEEMLRVLPSITTLPGNLTRAEVLHRYAAHSGRDVRDGVFYYAFGLFKTAVILQQIYARYQRGLTTDPRFAALGTAVSACALGASLSIDKGRIDRLSQ